MGVGKPALPHPTLLRLAMSVGVGLSKTSHYFPLPMLFVSLYIKYQKLNVNILWLEKSCFTKILEILLGLSSCVESQSEPGRLQELQTFSSVRLRPETILKPFN